MYLLLDDGDFPASHVSFRGCKFPRGKLSWSTYGSCTPIRKPRRCKSTNCTGYGEVTRGLAAAFNIFNPEMAGWLGLSKLISYFPGVVGNSTLAWRNQKRFYSIKTCPKTHVSGPSRNQRLVIQSQKRTWKLKKSFFGKGETSTNPPSFGFYASFPGVDTGKHSSSCNSLSVDASSAEGVARTVGAQSAGWGDAVMPLWMFFFQAAKYW